MMNSFFSRVWILLFPCLFLTGCPTLGQFQALEQRVTRTEKQNSEQVESSKTLTKRIENLYTKLESEGLDLRKSGNQLSTQIDQMKRQIQELEGKDETSSFQLTELTNELNELIELLDNRFNISASQLPSDLPKGPKGLLSAGDERLERGRYRMARAIYRELLQRHPKSKQSPKAKLQIGESYAREGNNDAAIREIKDMESLYRSSKEMPSGYLLIGRVLEKEKKCKKAIAIYEYFLDQAKKHPKRKDVKAKIKALKKLDGCKG
tara:strand:- start:347 stop:1138 length:792 start_codon:yes stop_codon:yes gene_type:complete